MCKLNADHSLLCKHNPTKPDRRHVNLIKCKPTQRVEKLAMKKSGQCLSRRHLLIILIELIAVCQTLPNRITIVDDQLSLDQTEYRHIVDQIGNQLLGRIRELIESDVQFSSSKYYELCNMSFINNTEKQRADAEFLDIDLWLNSGDSNLAENGPLDKFYNLYSNMYSNMYSTFQQVNADQQRTSQQQTNPQNNQQNNQQTNAEEPQTNKLNDRHQRERRSVNSPGFMRFVNKHNQNVPSDEQPEPGEKQRVIEVAIFIDRFLAAKYQNRMADLKRLVLTIMFQVQLIYNYSSMKTKLKIVIVKYEVLSTTSASPNTADGDIDKYLDNFCAWQARKYRGIRGQENWDHAIMLTGLNLYKDLGNGKKNKKVLGLAWVNGMCKPSYSCTLNEGLSFEASFVISHELGHSLGILHDGRGNNCDGDKYLMSEKTGPGKVNWSPCSNFYIENFISRGHARCLEETAVSNPELDFRSNVLPGQMYNADTQCKLALGTQYAAYFSSKTPFNDICRELWCITGNWATPAHPALEGTQCSSSGQCYQGTCKSLSELAAPGQPSARSSNMQSNLVSVQRNYMPVNSSTKQHENLQTDARLAKARMRSMTARTDKESGTTSGTKKSDSPKELDLNASSRKSKEESNDLNKNSLMEEIRSFLKAMTSNAGDFFEAFKFKLG